VQRNHVEAINWYSKAAAKGERGAQFSIARILETGDPSVRNPLKALEQYKKSAQDGDSHSEFLVGTFYEEGKTGQADLNKAIQSYKKAARDSELARVKLAGFYAKGVGVKLDSVEAYKWLELSKLTVESDPPTRQIKQQLEAILTPVQIKTAQAQAEAFSKEYNIQQQSMAFDFGYQPK
jgi:hypothetical protein